MGSRFDLAKPLGKTPPLSAVFSCSITSIAVSTKMPILGCAALSRKNDHRASVGTKKIFSAWYSSRSSGSAPVYSPSPCTSLAWCSSNESEMYLRKIKPNTTCLYSAASMFLRNLSAAFQSCFSNGSSLVTLAFAMLVLICVLLA